MEERERCYSFILSRTRDPYYDIIICLYYTYSVHVNVSMLTAWVNQQECYLLPQFPDRKGPNQIEANYGRVRQLSRRDGYTHFPSCGPE
jgi:hypothetical protein